MAVRRELELVDVSVDSLPQVFRGYDRAATRRLLDELREVNWNLLRERADLEQTLQSVQQTCATLGERERHLGAELERMRSAYEQLGRREQALRSDLDAAKREIARFENRELLLTGMVEAAKRTAERLRTEAREEASKALKKARERETDILRRADRDLARVERERERLTRLSDELRSDLSVVVTDVLGRFMDELAVKDAAGSRASPRTERSKPAPSERPPLFAAGDWPEHFQGADEEAPAVAAPSRPSAASTAVPPSPDDAATTPTAPVGAPAEVPEPGEGHSRIAAAFAYTGGRMVLVLLQGLVLVGALVVVLVVTRLVNF